MSGRRSYARFALNPASEGVLRVVRDVLVQRAEGDELVVISREAGVIDETMVIGFPESTARPALRVQVIDSKPIVVDGTVRHWLRLRNVGTVDSRAKAKETV